MDVVLINLVQTGVDDFKNPVYEETLDLYGKKAVYKLGIPKGDSHTWQDQDIEFFGETFHIFTTPQIGIEANVPTEWHHIYMCERYE